MSDLDRFTADLESRIGGNLRTTIESTIRDVIRDRWGRETETVIGGEIAALSKRFARAVLGRLDADPDLVAEMTAVARAALLEGVRRGAEEAGTKLGAKIAGSAVQLQQIKLIEGGR
jgi:hypothetical protein